MVQRSELEPRAARPSLPGEVASGARGSSGCPEHSGSGGHGLQERKSGKGPEMKHGVWKEARGKMPRELRPAERQGWSGKKLAPRCLVWASGGTVWSFTCMQGSESA